MARSKQMAHARLDRLRSKAADERMKARDSRGADGHPARGHAEERGVTQSFDPLVVGVVVQSGLVVALLLLGGDGLGQPFH
jgi:hypothetical protein